MRMLALVLLAATMVAADMYCGKRNCYDVLGVTRESTPAEIRKAYRSLSLQLHPDKNRDANAPAQFQEVVTAYEVLRDEDDRKNYDYMLDHPEEYFNNMYHYYRYRTPKVHLGPLLVIVITVISALQYVYWWNHHRTIVAGAVQAKSLRIKALRKAEEDGLVRPGMRKDEIEQITTTVLMANLDLQGSFAAPRITDVLWVKLLLSPYTLSAYLGWHVHWLVAYRVLGHPYSHEALIYLLCRNLKISRGKFDAVSEDEKEMLFDRELWIPENAAAYIKEVEENSRERVRDSGRYKQARRYMKSRGPSAHNYND